MATTGDSRHFGRLPGGETVEAFTLSSRGGLSVQVMTLGGIVTHLRTPDRKGDVADVVLGFDDLAGYLQPHPYFGAIAGRVAGRISGARFALDGREYPLACNDPPNHLHGGFRGFDKRNWSAQPLARADGSVSVRLSLLSPDGEEGYPGTARVSVTYTVTDQNELVFESEATTDRATPLSVTHHSYFNLAGEGAGTIDRHELQVLAGTYTPSDSASGLIGRREAVAGNDLRVPRTLGEVIPNLRGRHGDLYFVDRPPGDTMVDVARLYDPQSGRLLAVRSTEDCVQFYTGVSLDGTLVGKSRRTYGPFSGLCLECHGYPDGVNRPDLGNIILRPGEVRRHRTVYAFSWL